MCGVAVSVRLGVDGLATLLLLVCSAKHGCRDLF
jgi:hypothetical protein